MNVRCPHCGSRYELPEHLMGPAGAQVRCPDCRGVFGVGRDGKVHGPGRASSPAPTPASEPRDPDPIPVDAPAGAPALGAAPAPAPVRARSSPETVARTLVSELALRAGEAPRQAFARGTLFSEWGPALAELYGEYRRRVDAAASGAPLRAALLERWGIELPASDTT